jgi:predicted MFS family arabinose efflux permease
MERQMQIKSNHGQSHWLLIISAAAIMMITTGARQSSGLFVSPLVASTGLSIASISFALAVGQLFWGVTQPIFGAIADKWGSFPVLVFGSFLMALGMAMTPYATSEWMLTLTMGVISAAGAGAGSFAILIGATAQRLLPSQRSFAGGFINAGGSFGQFIFAPLTQMILAAYGWITAMFALAAASLLTIPLAWTLREKEASRLNADSQPSQSIGQQVAQAMKDRSYLCLHAGFFTCGFHVAFLVTHLPGEVALCGHSAAVSAAAIGMIGLFNIAGSLLAGVLGNHYRMKYILALMYGSRAVMIGLYLIAPKTELTFYIFAAALGFTWLATVPPTVGLVGKLFGTRYLATLFGLTILTHQVGGFLGAWLGGIAMEQNGSYMWMWYADILLSFAAALVNLPIREEKIVKA